MIYTAHQGSRSSKVADQHVLEEAFLEEGSQRVCVVHGEERKGVTAHTGGEVKMCEACWGSKNKPAADILCMDTSGQKMVVQWDKQIEARLWKDLLE